MANSYRDAGHLEKAIEYYKKRTELSGWYEEIWYSFYAIGGCYQKLGDMQSAIYYWMMASNVMPERIENLHKIIEYYRTTGKNELAYIFFRIADIKRKKLYYHDFLFLEKDVYDFRLDYEMSIIGYYCNHDSYDLTKICMKLLEKSLLEEKYYNNVINNYKFYSPKLSIFSKNTGEFLLNNIPDDFQNSTPTIIKHNNDKIYVNVRIVNYKIDDQEIGRAHV